MLKPYSLFLLLPLSLALLLISYSVSADIKQINQASFFGLKLLDSDISKVRDQLWNIGGFKQARSTKRKRAIDKFFISYHVKDTYYIEFRYTSSGKLLSAKRLYKPQSIHFKNKRTPIQTREIALDLIAELGQPTQITTVAGFRPYSKFKWETDKIKVIIDREGSEYSGNVFISYQVKTDPYFVASLEP